MNDVALLLFGHSRTFFQHVASYRDNIINVCDCDVFIQTWDMYDGGYAQVIKDNNARRLSTKQISDLNQVPNLVELKIFPENTQDAARDVATAFKKSSVRFKAPSKMISGCLYARRLCSDMLEAHEVERNRRYEYVIVATLDICVRTPIDVATLRTPGVLHITHASTVEKESLIQGNRLVFADRDTIDHWLKMHDTLDFTNYRITRRVALMESIVYDYFVQHDIKYADIGMSYDLVRLNGVRVLYDHVKQRQVVLNNVKCDCGEK